MNQTLFCSHREIFIIVHPAFIHPCIKGAYLILRNDHKESHRSGVSIIMQKESIKTPTPEIKFSPSRNAHFKKEIKVSPALHPHPTHRPTNPQHQQKQLGPLSPHPQRMTAAGVCWWKRCHPVGPEPPK